MEKFSWTSFSNWAPSWVRTGEAGRVRIRLFTVLLKLAVKEENAGPTVEQNRAAMQVRVTLEPKSREGRGGEGGWRLQMNGQGGREWDRPLRTGSQSAPRPDLRLTGSCSGGGGEGNSLAPRGASRCS